MNIAILIGIAKYERLKSLPACANDVVQMQLALQATQKYDEIKIVTATSADAVKASLREFFARFATAADIDEAFVYFSGHGGYQKDALFCCSDYDENRAATTSISNTELDDLLRSVNPKVSVKVVDACQSGAPYIKDAGDGFVKSLGKSTLASFICMASSQHNQNSFASATESYFTEAWINAALSKGSGEVLYRDIQASLADTFAKFDDQTPFFVNQGSGLESFSQVTSKMLKLNVSRVKPHLSLPKDKDLSSIIEMAVAKSDEDFVEHSAAMHAIDSSVAALIGEDITDSVVKKFYEKQVVTVLKLRDLPRQRAIATFAHEQGWQKLYFAHVELETYETRAKNPMAFIGLYGNTGADREYTVEKERPAYIRATENLPTEVIEIAMDAKNPSLPSYRTYIGIVHSRTDIMVLSATAPLIQKGWSTKEIDVSELKWEYHKTSWKSVVDMPVGIWDHAWINTTNLIRQRLDKIANNADSNVTDYK